MLRMILSLCLAAGLTAMASPALSADLTVLPLGDSITTGGGYPIGAINFPTYRYYLNNRFDDAGIAVDFVGPTNGVGKYATGEPLHTGPNCYPVPAAYAEPGHPTFPDQDFAGATGRQIDHFLTGAQFDVGPILRNTMPDVVLIHLGTNDLGGGQSPAGAANDMGTLIQLIRGTSDSVGKDFPIYVAQIMPLGEGAYGPGGPPNLPQKVIDYNAALVNVVGGLNGNPNYPDVTLVDCWTGFDTPAMGCGDGTHPNYVGDTFIAEQFAGALGVPEPASLAMLAIGALALLRRRQ